MTEHFQGDGIRSCGSGCRSEMGLEPLLRFGGCMNKNIGWDTPIFNKGSIRKEKSCEILNSLMLLQLLKGSKGQVGKTLPRSALMNRMSSCWRWLWNICAFLLECAGFIAWFWKTNEQSYGCQMTNKRGESFQD